MGERVALCLLMGLGFITGVVCIVRTAFSWQVTYEDLSWVEIPNGLARIIEVNLGIIAACTPMMKPFVRYVRASVTGNDPYDMLSRGKRQRTMSHIQGHAGFRVSSPHPSTMRLDSRQPHKLPAAAHKMSYQPDHVFDPPSIVLPFQGTSLEPTSSTDEEAPLKALGSRRGQKPGPQRPGLRPGQGQGQRARNEEFWEGDGSFQKGILAAVERR